jgi:hypothetical protein
MFEMDRLESTVTTTIIRKLKTHFARYGIPNTVFSDNGPQFTSERFQNFAEKYDFEHIRSDPHYHQSNGKAESAVKTAKNLLRKNRDGDQFLALLNYRNTPSQNTGTSPNQRFLNRRTRTLLPVSNKMLKPKITLDSDRKAMLTHQAKQKQRYDQKAKDLKRLKKGDHVMLQPMTGKKKWTKGTVIATDGNRSYDVMTKEGAVYARNRRHLRGVPTPLLQPTESTERKPDAPQRQQPSVSSSSPVSEPQKAEDPAPAVQPASPVMAPTTTTCQASPSKTPSRIPTPIRTSSGREVRSTRMKDFVYN